jgi:hypothetical protein
MHRTPTLEAALFIGFFSTLGGSPARAQTWQTDTSTLHVVEPLHVPGAVLEPGFYKLRVVQEQSDRNIVQITDTGENRIYATVMATPHEAARTKPDSEFVFDEDADGHPMALRSWWAPDDRYGQDFVYSRQDEAELTRLAERRVSPDEQVASASSTSMQTKAAPAAEPPAAAPRPEAVVAAKEPATAARMPHTASPVPLAGLGGLSALAAAAALRARARRPS